MEYRSSYEQANTFQSYWQDNPYPNFYNENPRNQPNFSWTSNDVPNPPFQPTYQEPYHSPYQSAYQPPGFQQPQQYTPPQPQHQPNSEVAELRAELKAMMQQNMTAQKNREAQISQLMAHNKMIENQIAQLATSNSTRQQGSLPPQGQQPHETVNAITLRSGTHYKGPEMPKGDQAEILDDDIEVEVIDDAELKNKESKQGEIHPEHTIRSNFTSTDRISVQPKTTVNQCRKSGRILYKSTGFDPGCSDFD